jgi:cobaltochelatase CobN
MDPHETYHQPDLPPTHHYAAFYHALALAADRGGFGVDAIVHMGKHGTLEWLPGKSVGLSNECFPDALLADMPLIYPFLVSDPGEGTQAKRRAHAVIVDHLAPPMTNAQTYGPLQTLKELLDDYYRTENLDPVKLPMLRRQIWEQVQSAGLQTDLTLRGELRHGHSHEHDPHESHGLLISPEGIGSGEARWVEKLEEYLCELGLLQIRDGLHVLGEMPPLPETLRALTRLQNAAAPSLQRALAQLMGFELEQLLAHPGRRLPTGVAIRGVDCATCADVLEALEVAALALFAELERDGFQEEEIQQCQMAVLGRASREVTDILRFACRTLVPAIEQVTDEIDNVLAALDGKYVPAGPAGAPTRGMAHVLPTGRNFHTMDPRAIPSMAAWEVGQRLAQEVIERYRTERSALSETVSIAVWGTSQMRTQGDDIAQVLSLLGVEPVWDPQTRRLSGIQLIPLSILRRPRIDVLVRISGLFRDAFSHVIDILDEAVQLVIGQDEPLTENFPRKHYLEDLAKTTGVAADDVEHGIRRRIFGAKPGAYGTGIQEMIARRNWRSAPDFAQAFVSSGGYAYGGGSEPVEAQHAFTQQLRRVSIAVQNQDNREHDIFDSSEYYQFHGGLIAAAQVLSGKTPAMYVGDNSRPERPCVRDLREEALRVYRSRVVNPKWIEGIKRHGYRGGLELAATVDNIFAFDAVAGIAPDLVYEGLAENYAFAADVRRFLQDHNPWALQDIANRLLEAASRGMWESADSQALERLRGISLEAETAIEARAENLQELA